MFVSLDGVDGVGKSTQHALLCQWLRERGRDVVACRDPGGTPLGEELRRLLLEHRGWEIALRSEMLIYMAARAQLVAETIAPALARGAVVVADRFLLANVAYQGYGGGLDVDDVWQVGRIATGGVTPDLTLVLDMPPAAAAGRLGRQPDRMESRGGEFFARVRDGFLAEAERHPERIALIDADRDIDEVQAEIRRRVAALLARDA